MVQAIQEPVQNGQTIAGERERKKARKRYLREMKALINKQGQTEKALAMRANQKQGNTRITSEKKQQMLHGSHLKNRSIKKTLLFHKALIHEFNQNQSPELDSFRQDT